MLDVPNTIKKISRYSPVLTVIMTVNFLTVVVSANAQIEQTVAQDIFLNQSFLTTSDEIEAREATDFVTIGGDGACDFFAAFSSIQDVIDTNPIEIRVASNGLYQGNLELANQGIVIRGGFESCAAANNNIQDSNDLTPIDGSMTAGPVIAITSQDEQVIRLENFLVTGGDNDENGGGISVEDAEVELQLLRMALINNDAESGGGLSVNSGINTVFGRDVIISQNSATSGGGVNCGSVQNKIVFTGMSLIANNQANFGGGVNLRSCSLNMYSSLHDEALTDAAGIISNQAVSLGGGAYMLFGSTLRLFGQKMCDGEQCLGANNVPIQLSSNNTLLAPNANDHGGGLYMRHALNPPTASGTRFYANGIIMEDNQSSGNGAGAYIQANTSITIERSGKACWNDVDCNQFKFNQPGSINGLGGVFYVEDGALNLSHSDFTGNRADFGTVIYATGGSAEIEIEASTFDFNGSSGNGDYSDFYVISATDGAAVSLKHSTFALNRAQNAVFNIDSAFNASMNLLASIIYDESSGNVFSTASTNTTVTSDCVLAHEAVSFTGNNTVVADPLFVSFARRDFHLLPGSPAIDMCQETAMNHPLDFDYEPRGWDDPEGNNGAGIFDAGVDESYATDIIFTDGFDPQLAM